MVQGFAASRAFFSGGVVRCRSHFNIDNIDIIDNIDTIELLPRLHKARTLASVPPLVATCERLSAAYETRE